MQVSVLDIAAAAHNANDILHAKVYRAGRHDDPRHDDSLCVSKERSLSGKQSKSVVPVQQILDMRKSGCIDIRYNKRFGKKIAIHFLPLPRANFEGDKSNHGTLLAAMYQGVQLPQIDSILSISEARAAE